MIRSLAFTTRGSLHTKDIEIFLMLTLVADTNLLFGIGALTSILQVYLNMSANQTGDIIKLLTLITVITMPLIVVGTWYGMNFEGVHELKWKYGYELGIAITLLSTGLTVWWFKKNKWL